jgi:hypothetical protein
VRRHGTHFAAAETVGQLIPGLTKEQRDEMIVSLQLKEATHISTEALEREAERALTSSAPTKSSRSRNRPKHSGLWWRTRRRVEATTGGT